METWVMAACRKRHTRRLAFWGILALCALLFAAMQYRYILNFAAGPFPMTEGELSAIADAAAAPRYFVQVKGLELIETGLQEITTTKRNGVEESREVTADYCALILGQRVLIVRAEAKNILQEGWLRPMDDDLKSHLQLTEEDAAVLPFYLDSASFRKEGYWGLAVYAVLFALILGFGIPAWRRVRDIGSDPVVQRVAAWGDPIGTSHEIERQLGQMTWARKGGVALTPDFIVRDAFFTFDVLRFDDLLWGYMKVIKKSVNFIPTGKDYQALLHCRGGNMTFQSSESDVQSVLERCAQRAPWAFIGFSQELLNHFTKNNPAFCEAVEARRRELQQSKGPGAEKS